MIWRDADRADATYVIGAAPSDPLGDVEISGVPRRSFALPRLSPGGRGRVLLQIATYFEPPTATLRLQVLDANGRRAVPLHDPAGQVPRQRPGSV